MKHSHLAVLRVSVLGALACNGSPKIDDTSVDGCESQCEGGESVLDPTTGAATGFERCGDGSINRVEVLAQSPAIEDTCAGTETYLDCTTAEDCTSREHGACRSYSYIDSGETACGCSYSCATDADCGDGQACVPAGLYTGQAGFSICVTATCTSNADCGCGECGLSVWDDGCGPSPQLACRTPDDDCRTSQECADAGLLTCGLSWDASEGDAWTCSDWNCAIGRPLLVEGQARTAGATPRTDWSAEATVEATDAVTRRMLAAHWIRVGQLEHASVASFARFTLQLMALGAPSDLLGDTQRAAADEVEHARLCFGLAAAYGEPVGPAPLALADVVVSTDPAEVVRSLVEEACVGETLGVAEALHAADGCEDPEVREVLLRIAADEQRHAELAWRTLRWLCADDALREVALEALRRAMADVVAAAAGEGLHLPGHGVLGPVARTVLHREVVEAVLEPALAALARSGRALNRVRAPL